ncbi:NAD(P)-binding domain-containing protein [Amycolatopsis sp. RTGN1]|uniref:NAD(P)-binding domain-containing protein n=1 Tax=Amycolatopsis ponsaeliensis TaxID=2992142 RepID=UPI00254E1AF4|nr:NAD(P)-binding domain-containing protein [Amycolatopsis sp. RTGN1]
MDLDNIIVGAGPAGLQLAYFFERAGRPYLILEKDDGAGSAFETNPRHRTMISFNKINNYFPEPEFNLRHDWNSLLSDDESMLFRNFSQDLYPAADDYVRYLRAYRDRFGLRAKFGERVARISRTADGFALRTESGNTYSCRRVFMATGACAPLIPDDIDGVDLVDTYEEHDLDQELYKNARVAVIGAGNSAFEVANHLAGHAAIVHIMTRRPARHAWNTHFPGDLRSVNNTILDMYQLKSLHATLGFRPKTIKPKASGGFTVVAEEDYPHWTTPGTGRVTMHYDRIIVCTGWRYVDTSLFDSDCTPEVDQRGKFPILGPDWQTSVPGLYFAGTATQARDRKAASGFIHGFRYNAKTLFHLVEREHYQEPLPGEQRDLRTAADLDELAEAVIRRVSTTSALYQQNGQLCDAMVVGDGTVDVRRELPIEWVLRQEEFASRPDLVLLSLEYGFHQYAGHLEPVSFIHPADPTKPECSAFLHPVLRWYRNGELQEKVDLTESLVVRYDMYDYDENHDSAHLNRVKNLFNRVHRVTPETFTERSYLPDQETAVFRPWTAEEIEQRSAQQPHVESPCHYAN